MINLSIAFHNSWILTNLGLRTCPIFKDLPILSWVTLVRPLSSASLFTKAYLLSIFCDGFYWSNLNEIPPVNRDLWTTLKQVVAGWISNGLWCCIMVPYTLFYVLTARIIERLSGPIKQPFTWRRNKLQYWIMLLCPGMFCTCRALPYGYLLGHSSETNTRGNCYVVRVHNGVTMLFMIGLSRKIY